MEEKVLYEIRYVETEDGFRIEATGDKKGLRRMGFGPLSLLGAGKRVRHDHGHGGRRMRHMRARRAMMGGEGPRHGHGPGRGSRGPGGRWGGWPEAPVDGPGDAPEQQA